MTFDRLNVRPEYSAPVALAPDLLDTAKAQNRTGQMLLRSIRRGFAMVFCLAVLVTKPLYAQNITVTLLGTGAPPPAMNRFGPSILVEAGAHRFLFDAGRGALQRLAEQKVAWNAIDAIFLTHLHSDHLVGLPDLWLTGWLVGPGRNRPLQVIGPQGTERMMSHLKQAFDFDVQIRQIDDRAVPDGVIIVSRDIVEGGVFDSNGVKVTAFEVDHTPVRPAFGYRIDYLGRSVVLSGDTRQSENLIRHAQGADVLIHEVAAPNSFVRAGVGPERTKSVLEHHVTPEQAGEVFAKIRPRLAVYSHIVQPSATEADLIPPTRMTYSGPVEVGEDRMVIEIGERIDVRRVDR